MQTVDAVDHRGVVKPRVGVRGIGGVSAERDRARDALGEVRPIAVSEGEVAAARRILLAVVRFDEGARPANHVEPHQLAPVIAVLALVEGGKRAKAALMAAYELDFAQLTDDGFGANAEILAVLDEETKL